jgi:hypothetical protein
MKKIVVLISLTAIMFFGCTDNSTTPEDDLLPPTDFNLVQLDNDKIHLTWQDNSTEEESFCIDRKIEENDWEVKYQMLPENTTTFIDSNLTFFGEYTYRVYGSVSDTEHSDYVESQIEFVNSDSLAAPSNLVLSQLDAYQIRLDWSDNSTVEDGFIIDRKIGENEWEANYQVLPVNSNNFTDTDLETIDTYSYRVRAFSNSDETDFTEASVDFFYNDVSSIVYQVQIFPYDSSHFRFSLKDIEGNTVEREYDVWFKFLTCPEGTNLNETLFGTTDSLSVRTQEGEVSVYLFPGQQSGVASIKIYTYDSNSEEISLIKSNIVIHSGIPTSANLSIGGMNSGVDIGAGFWEIEVAAFLTDDNSSPVGYGTAVLFSLPDNPDWASFSEFYTYTGNENAEGDSTSGVAYTTLTYSGIYSNEALSIRIQSGDFEETVDVILPVQFPQVYVDLVPDMLYWCQNDPSDIIDKTCMINVYVADGQQNPISNQRVEFNVALGNPSETDGDNQGDFFAITDENGYITKHWDFPFFQVPTCYPPSWSSTITTQVVADILYASASDNETLTLIRYCDCSTNE